ncbi:MAG: type II toxin-antitoxin system HicB family antitoxin [Defluviitaleaceae bacterium]|nr:type II toxin-antitoxin system HicB family antitoxin [Defluviitaleaceae bacterium]MCL2240184.1 type II toxin-antitoxin system HicB family antitoxin [Defluviitaleaceae bacterium]
MKTAYPVIFTRVKEGYIAHAPDFPLDTQGGTMAEAIEMARDAIGISGIDMEDDNKRLPEPSLPEKIKHKPGEFVSMVDIDFVAYRKANDKRTVRRNVSLPSWLNREAEKAGINVSAILQTALKQELKTAE